MGIGATVRRIREILGLCRTEERLIQETPGTDGGPDRLVYVVTDRRGHERPAHRERFHVSEANRCPECGGIVTDICNYDERVSEEEGCATWTAELMCEQCHWKPSEAKPCVDWYLGPLVYDDEIGE